MTPEETTRLMALKSKHTAETVLADLLGVDPRDSYLEGRFRSFLRQRPRWAREVAPPGYISRSAFELFLAHHRLLPLRFAAANLGMTEGALRDVLTALDDKGQILLDFQGLDARVVPEGLIHDMPRNFLRLRAVVFADHHEQCEALHGAIAAELGIDAEPLWCATSACLGQRRYAWQHCLISQEPVSIPYEVALDFGKPLRLRPDVCSLVFYARNQEALASHLLGSGPLDADLERLRAA